MPVGISASVTLVALACGRESELQLGPPLARARRVSLASDALGFLGTREKHSLLMSSTDRHTKADTLAKHGLGFIPTALLRKLSPVTDNHLQGHRAHRIATSADVCSPWKHVVLVPGLAGLSKSLSLVLARLGVLLGLPPAVDVACVPRPDKAAF